MKLNFLFFWLEFLHMVYLNFDKGFDKNLKEKPVNTKLKWGLGVVGAFENG